MGEGVGDQSLLLLLLLLVSIHLIIITVDVFFLHFPTNSSDDDVFFFLFFMLLLYLSCLIVTCHAIGRTQSTSVEGVLLCEDGPAKDVLIKLYDHDTVSPDELMDSATTDSEGHFKLSGSADEISGIEPKINIYHDCDDGILPCQRRLTIFIPSKYVSSTKQPSKVFNIGRVQLAGKYAGESRDCLH